MRNPSELVLPAVGEAALLKRAFSVNEAEFIEIDLNRDGPLPVYDDLARPHKLEKALKKLRGADLFGIELCVSGMAELVRETGPVLVNWIPRPTTVEHNNEGNSKHIRLEYVAGEMHYLLGGILLDGIQYGGEHAHATTGDVLCINNLGKPAPHYAVEGIGRRLIVSFLK